MNELFDGNATRRGFFARGAALTAGAAAASLLLSQSAEAAPTANLGIPTTSLSLPGSGDTQVLNYALTLEDLEADLYTQALNRLTTGGNTGTKAAASVGILPGAGLNANDKVVQYLSRFAPIEAAHRNFLFDALGNDAITRQVPKKYDFGLQLITGDTNTVRTAVLNLVLQAEATGVQAYLGAIPFFSTGSQYLSVAAAIQGTEARHTTSLTILRNLLVAGGLDSTDPARTPVAPLRGDLGGNPQFQTSASHGNEAYVSATPNQGDTFGIDLYLLPTEVVNRVGAFIKTA